MARGAAAPPMTTLLRVEKCRSVSAIYVNKLSHTVGTPAESVTPKRSIKEYTDSPSSHRAGGGVVARVRCLVLVDREVVV
jgi:hypothetical protein